MKNLASCQILPSDSHVFGNSFIPGKVLTMLEKIGNQEAVSSLLDIISDTQAAAPGTLFPDSL